MDYKRLITQLLALDTRDLDAMRRMLTLLSDVSDPMTLDLLNDLKAYEKIHYLVSAFNKTIISPDTQSQYDRFLNRIERLAECEGKLIPHIATYVTGAQKPYFESFDMIYVSFGGVGMEYDEPHYALVWEDNHSDGEITIIPTTSQYTKDFATVFSIGIISGLPATKTILSVAKLTRISRKRVIFHRGKYVQGKIPRPQVKELKTRIHEAIAIGLQGYYPLEYFIKNSTASALPASLLTDNFNRFIRFIPVKLDECIWDPTAMKVHYRPWNESTVRSLDMKNPVSYLKKEYKIHRIYEKIFQDDMRIKQEGKDAYTRLYLEPALIS
jgi:hypothetical protein